MIPDARDGGFWDKIDKAVDAGDGNDTIIARDGLVDNIVAGAGVDFVELDLRDPFPNDAENAARLPVNEPAPAVTIASAKLRVDRKRTARIRMRCPKKETRGCAGRLTLNSLKPAGRGGAKPGKRLGQGRFDIERGETSSVPVTVSPGVSERGVRATAVTPGEQGAKTAIRRLAR